MTQSKINKETAIINKKLSVQVKLTGLSFLVTDLDNGQNSFFLEKIFDESRTPEELLIEFEIIYSQNEELNTLFKKVVVSYSNDLYTLVPQSLFDESKLSDYLKFNSKILSNDYIAYDKIENHDLNVIYVPYVNINNFILEKYGNFEYYHSISILLRSSIKLERHVKLPKVYIHVSDSSFDMIILESGKLALCNTYKYYSPQDFIYFVLFGFEQLAVNPDTVDVILLGNITDNDEDYKILYEYVRNISFLESKSHISHDLSDGPTDKYFILINS